MRFITNYNFKSNRNLTFSEESNFNLIEHFEGAIVIELK